MSHHSKYAPTISDRVPMTEGEANEAIEHRSELIAQLRVLLRLEQAAYKQAAADLEEGELLDPESIYIQGPSQVLESHSESPNSPDSKVCHGHLGTHHLLIDILHCLVYKDPVGPSSSKRKAEDEGAVPKAKKQNALIHKAPDVGLQGEQGDGLALSGEGPAVLGEDPPGQNTPDVGQLQAPKERNIKKPMSRLRKEVKHPNVTHQRLVLEDKQPPNGMAMMSREEANKALKKKPVKILRGSGAGIETPKPARASLQPSMGPPVALKPQVGAESAFDQMSKRNKEALKDQTIQDAVDRKLRIDQEKDNRTDKNGRRAARQVAPQLRSTALSKKRKSENPLAQPKDECERTPDWQRSFSTGPPKTTTSKPTIAQVQEGSNETMVSGKAGSIDRKRKAEEGLEGKEAKIAKGNKGPFSESRSTSPKRANVPAQNLTAHETIFGKGSKPRKPDIQHIRVPRCTRPDHQPRQVATSEHTEDS